MHNLVLSGIAVLAVLATVTGGRSEPAGPGQTNGPMAHGHDVAVLAMAAQNPWPQPAWMVSRRAGADTPR